VSYVAFVPFHPVDNYTHSIDRLSTNLEHLERWRVVGEAALMRGWSNPRPAQRAARRNQSPSAYQQRPGPRRRGLPGTWPRLSG